MGKFCRAMILLKQLAPTYWEVFPELFKILPESSPPPRTLFALTQKLWQNTTYLQLVGLNNWFYAVITIFAQHLNICSPKLGE